MLTIRRFDEKRMTTDWTPHATAQALLEIFPTLGHFLSTRLREEGEEEATMMQLRTLMVLQEHPMTTSELAKKRKVSLQSVSVLVQGIVEKGWLTRVPDPNDRRQQVLQVTAEGRERARAAHEQITNAFTDVLTDLTPDELEAASIFLPALRRTMNTHLHPEPVPEK